MAGNWLEPEADPRKEHGYTSERDLLLEYLDNYRLTLQMKCDGLTPEQLASQSVPPSTMSLLGLVRHLAGVEWYWFERVMLGIDGTWPFSKPDDRDAEFTEALGTQECVDAAFAEWRKHVAAAQAYMATVTDLEVAGVDRHGDTILLRDLLIHMIEEYARHCGHADLLREAIDGRTGF
ncbi:MAG TPA: DinB family protein [Jatrophihabitans sp.]|jgi:hypothetical protein